MARSFDSVAITTEFALRLFAFLRDSGIKLGTQQTIACTAAIVARQVLAHQALLRICRVTLVNRKEDLPELERLYAVLLASYVASGDDTNDALAAEKLELQVTSRAYAGDDATADDEADSTETAGYSIKAVDHQEDFRRIPQQEFPVALAALERIARRFAVVPRRKYEPARRGGTMDLRASLRESRKYGGELMVLRYRARVPTRTRLLVLVDVSGSMEVYGVFLLNFLFALQRSRWLELEVFAFSTDIQRLTPGFRRRNFDAVLEQLSASLAGWSGGTRIGHAVQRLNDDHAAILSTRTLVTIMSDGWDTGEIDLLDREMARLHERVRGIVWMNPLKADPRYEPLAQGMATARPYCDEFITGHSIASFGDYARLVAS